MLSKLKKLFPGFFFLIKNRGLLKLYIKVYYKFKFKQLKSSLNTRNKKIYINLYDGKLARYIYLLTHYLRNSFTVYLHSSFKLLTDLNDYSNWTIDEPNVFIKKINLKPDEGKIVLNNKIMLNFKLNYDYFSAVKYKYDGFIFPYFMHVGQYKWGYVDNIDLLRKSKRSMLAFFVGGVSEEHYNNKKIGTIFKCLTRYEVIKELENCNSAYFPESIEDLENMIKLGIKKLTLYITGTYNEVEKWLWQKDWLKTIAKANFFLALPGTTMPLCHNLIEAMSVGTIPILQYNEFIHPQLVNNKNCIVYNDLNHLKCLLDEIAEYSENKIINMRQNVIHYYDNYFTINAFEDNLERFLNKNKNKDVIDFYINAENISSMLYGKRTEVCHQT